MQEITKSLVEQQAQFFHDHLDMMCIANVDGFFKIVNPAFEKTLGFTQHEILSYPFWHFIHPEDKEYTIAQFVKLSQAEEIVNFEHRLLSADGNYKIVSWTASSEIKSGSIYAVGRDFTNLRSKEIEYFQFSEALTRSALVVVTDRSGRAKRVNENYLQLCGYSREELIGENMRIVKSDEQPKGLFKNIWDTITEGTTWIGNIQNKAKDGRPFFIHTVITPITDFNGKICEYLSIGFDITAQRTVEKEINQFVRQLEDAQSISKIGSWELDIKTKNLEWSKEHYKIFGIEFPKAKEELFQVYLSRIHLDDLSGLKELIAKAQMSGEPYTHQHRIILSNKQLKHVRTIAEVIRDADGFVIKLRGTCQDITEMVQKEEENNFVLSSVQIGIWKYSPLSESFLWDKNMYRLYGRDEKEFKGDFAQWKTFLCPENQESTVNEFIMALKASNEFSSSFRIITSQGEKRFIQINCKIVRNSQGDAVMAYGVAKNCSKEMELEAELNLERTKALHSAKLASLGEMSAGIAHEINNPLAIISSNILLLDKFKDDPEKFASKVSSIQRSAERISKIVIGLKKFSRLNENNEHVAIVLQDILTESLSLTVSKSKRHGTPIEVVGYSSSKIWCDEVEIEQVIINLINNAIDAVKESDERWVRVFLFDEGPEVVLQIRDSGHGISKEVEEKMFHPFFTTKPVGKGTGLGLSIVKGILENHSATIAINRDDDHTCFEIRFPLYKEIEVCD